MNHEPQSLSARFELSFEPERYRRWIAKKEVVIHCHHYNARIQKTIEGATAIDGKSIFVTSAEAVFAEQIADSVRDTDSLEEMWRVATALYAHLGYGKLDVSDVSSGIVTASHSHFVEGWRAGFALRSEPVCSLTEGFLQGAIATITGRPVYVREIQCQLAGSQCCRFAIDDGRSEPVMTIDRHVHTHNSDDHSSITTPVTSPNVDERKIIDALVEMPIHGNEDGLIPAFNVFLANTPADFYNLACIRFLEAMDEVNLGDVARSQLFEDAETCGMNTFRGIISSAEWDALIAPMIVDPSDTLFGIIAVSNALGWGNWRVTEHTAGETLTLVSANGYEASGYRLLRDDAQDPTCLMLCGVSAGIMELLYGEGSIQERFGQFAATENGCRACGQGHCGFGVEAA